MATPAKYWSESKLATWLLKRQGIVPLQCGTAEAWEAYEADCRQKAPFTYWLTDTAFNQVQQWLRYPYDRYDALRYWCLNAFGRRYHVLDTKLPRQYHELDTRILHGIFEAFVDFVEVEKAWMLFYCVDEAKARYKLPWHQRFRFLRWKTWRCPPAGLEYLQLEANGSEHEAQAQGAREQLELYHWWKARPNRQDPYLHAQNFSEQADEAFGVAGLFSNKKWPLDISERYYALLTEASALAEQQYQEDNEMLVKLVKLRSQLWT